MFTTSPENARVVAAVADLLAENSLNGRVTEYETIDRVAGFDIRRERRFLLDRAVRKAEKRCQCIFAAVRGIGIKRLHADETASVGSTTITSVRHKTSKTMTRMRGVNSNEMSADGRLNASLKVAHVAWIHGFADNRKTSSLISPVTADPEAAKKATKKL